MTPSTIKPWADGPFKLIESPDFKHEGKISKDVFLHTATQMSVVHNVLIRGLNTIYLQAPHVQPKEYKTFINYAKCFHSVVSAHHHGEEMGFFVEIEKAVGIAGLMDVNIEQHRTFHDGLESMNEYLTSLKGKEDTFRGPHLCEIIDSFGTVLEQHLNDEIDMLVGLKIYGDKLSHIGKLLDDEGKRGMGGMPISTFIVWAFANHDVTFENGIGANFPEAASGVMIWMIKHVFSWIHPSWWKFASCDRSGRPKPLYATKP